MKIALMGMLAVSLPFGEALAFRALTQERRQAIKVIIASRGDEATSVNLVQGIHSLTEGYVLVDLFLLASCVYYFRTNQSLLGWMGLWTLAASVSLKFYFWELV
jgi:hypothetical protein